MYDTNGSDQSAGLVGVKPPMSKKDVVKVINYLTEIADKVEGEKKEVISYYDENDPEERQLDFIVEEAKRQD